MLFRFVPPTVCNPEQCVGSVRQKRIDRDDDAAREALHLMEQGVVVNVGGHGKERAWPRTGKYAVLYAMA
ncbi:MAG: hypothetical protein CM15mP120_19490 [Pseudomonadota bacterium]|nr:MAG: hypothetical protein CM15mP120_19490 [Pseudomonadota bacterium]